jgi:hypothetical protein
MGAMGVDASERTVDQAIIRLLGHRFGDGLVYMRDSAERAVFWRAVNLGLISAQGYVTPAGLALAHRNEEC